MKHLSLVAAIIFALVIISCGAKKEKTEELNTDNQIAEETIDTNKSYEEFMDDGFSENVNPADSSKTETMIYTDASKAIQIDPPIESKKEEAIEKKEVITTKEIKETPKVHETRYYVVVGSFKKYSNAQNLFNYFKNKGYSPLILPKEKGYNRVAITSYTKEVNARNAIKKLRADHNDLTFWLYKW